MLAFGLDALKEAPLKDLANQLGVPQAATLTTSDAVREIKARLAPHSALVFVPFVPSDSGRLGKWSLRISVGSLLITFAVAIATWWGTIAAVNKIAVEEREKEELAWQTTIVFKIIDEGSKDNPAGIAFGDINSKYVSESISAEGIRLEKKKLQPTELRRILMGLLGDKLVYQTAEDRYIVLRSLVVQGGDLLVYEVNRATGEILQVLASEAGRYSEKELEPIVREKAKVSSAAYLIAVEQQVGGKGVQPDKDNKLWLATNPPPANRARKDASNN
jgi:hypothetical protein